MRDIAYARGRGVVATFVSGGKLTAMDTPAIEIPTAWSRHGLVIPRPPGNNDYGVMGDPCIVWDEEVSNWRMVLFCDPPGNGQTICLHQTDGLPDKWAAVEPIRFVGPELKTHKPYIVQEAHRPNRAARIDGQYWLVSVMIDGRRKFIQRARSANLAGPWTWDPQPLIPSGGPGEFDEKHTDAVSGFISPSAMRFYISIWDIRPRPSRAPSVRMAMPRESPCRKQIRTRR